jgi:hypothetical protein
MAANEDTPLCSAYDQIAGRTCRYYAGHGGRHNFARLDHNCALERELRRELDETRKALADALDLFDATWCAEHGHAPTPEQFTRASELSKIVGRSHDDYDDIVRSTAPRRRST